MKLSVRHRRNLSRILPFGLIWLFTGWIFLLVETAAMGTPSPGSPVNIDLTFSVFVFASISVFGLGLLVGVAELLFMQNLFRNRPFLQKVIFKFILYTLAMFIVICITYPLAASIESGIPLLDERIWERFRGFLGSITFYSTLLQMAASIMLSTIYAAISENLGYRVMINFITGKYHRPREEERIFLFLDMHSSTALAEKLGNERYFKLLRKYYSELSDAIIKHEGEVYQYVGDEVVISWKSKVGLKNNNCIRCFFAMKEDMKKRQSYYNDEFGIVPTFKGGMHMGKVTTGEIGALKKEIFFTGDVLNVASRIQGLCKEFEADLLISGPLAEKLSLNSLYKVVELGEQKLKGKVEQVEVYAVEKVEPN